jgi:hypothetical protein
LLLQIHHTAIPITSQWYSRHSSSVHSISGTPVRSISTVPEGNLLPRTEARYWVIGLIYLLAYSIAVCYRITISDWLTAQLPL